MRLSIEDLGVESFEVTPAPDLGAAALYTPRYVSCEWGSCEYSCNETECPTTCGSRLSSDC